MNTSKPANPFSKLPPVDRVLATAAATDLIGRYGRKSVTAAVRSTIAELRAQLQAGASVDLGAAGVIERAKSQLEAASQPSLRPLYNMTGTVLHTNLGRAALPLSALEAVMTVAGGASNLEFNLDAGRRGERDEHTEARLTAITGAEAATVVNNNAAAVMLVLNTLGLGKDVAVSRGELVEIGGSFRIPDIMARSGASLVEVGTTNRTHLKDFRRALDDGAGMIMKVHTSNYVIEGFTAEVAEAELAALARARGVPFINDLGSGTLVNLEDYGLPHEPTPMDALKNGADVVTFSGDKLLGGPQAGIIVGRRDLIDAITANPMKRALRCDKMTIAALEAVLALYADPDQLAESLPTLRWLTRRPEEMSAMAQPVAEALRTRLGDRASIEVIDCLSQIGSGALPTRTVASVGIALAPSVTPDGAPNAPKHSDGAWLATLAHNLRQLPRPVIGRIHDGRLILDLRCLDDAAGLIGNFASLEPPQ